MNSGRRAMAFWRRGAAVAACFAVCVCLASCGWSAPSGQPASFRAGDDQNGTSMTLHPGQTLLVTLASTYWSFQGSSDTQVLAPVGAPVISPASCPPGGGCGTVAQEFRAVGSGTAQVTASRVTCGEAMRCVGASGQYQLTVTVTVASQ